jgi:hypothetical protein
VLVPWYKSSLYHTPIKPDLRGFLEIGVFAQVITRFASLQLGKVGILVVKPFSYTRDRHDIYPK